MCIRVLFHQTKNGLSGLHGLLHELQRPGGDLLVDGFHALLGQRAGVVDTAVGKAVNHPARAELLLELGVFRVVGVFRLLLGVQVVEVAEEFVEAVIGRQHLVAVTEVVLAELAGDVTERLEQPGDGRVFLLHTFRRTRQSDLGQAGADGRLAGDESGATGRAALLAVPVGEQGAFFGDAVDIRRLVAHHAHVVGADVELADVITPDHQDVGSCLRPAPKAQGWRPLRPR